MCLLCTAHHQALHAGRLAITGRAPELVITRIAASAAAGAVVSGGVGVDGDRDAAVANGMTLTATAPRGARPETIADAVAGLRQLGFSAGEATGAVQRAAQTSASGTCDLPERLEDLLRAALRLLKPPSSRS